MSAGEPVVVAKYVSEREQAARCMDVARSLWWTLLRENWPGNFKQSFEVAHILFRVSWQLLWICTWMTVA